VSRKGNPRTADPFLPGDVALQDVSAQVRLWTRGLGIVKRVGGVIVATVPAVLMDSHGPQIKASCGVVTNEPVTFKEVDP
jgi:hypothetical protein